MNVKLFGWFPKVNSDILDSLIKEYNIETVIEVGVFLGLSTKFFAERCEHVYAVDTFEGSQEKYLNSPKIKEYTNVMYDQFIFNMKSLNLLNKITPLKMKSEDASEMNISADLIYIDGSHEYEEVKKDIKIWEPKAKKILCGDDYTDNWLDVKRAVDESNLDINKNQRVWFYIK